MARQKPLQENAIRTKVVCTIGPASNSKETMRRMVLAGADVFRLNFSHGTHADHLTVIKIVREIGEEMGRPFALLGDLSGPKLRLGDVIDGGVLIEDDELVILTSGAGDGTGRRFSVNFPGFHEVAQPGEKIMLDDGKLQLLVDRVDGQDVLCQVLRGGVLKSRKGVNLPDTKLPIPALTEKDRRDLEFALKNGVDLIALSFVRSPEDIELTRAAMREFGREVPILAKIEKKEAIDYLEAIIRVADGAMVARGDLGIEIPMQQVPRAQKRIIRLCNENAKPVITATQMLESMIASPSPTRAEVTDIYNAILDGTDAIMLSGETAAGTFPVEAVETMNAIAGEAEKTMRENRPRTLPIDDEDQPTVTRAVCRSAVRIAERLKLDLIIVPTVSGYSALHVSRFRPTVPIFACSTNADSVNRLCVAWGVKPRMMARLEDHEIAVSETDALINGAIRTAKHYGIARTGQRAIVLGGVPLGKSHHTNLLHIVEIS